MGLTRVERVGAPDFITALRRCGIRREGLPASGREPHYTELDGLRCPKARHPIYYAVFQDSSVAVGVAPQLSTVAAPEEIGGGRGFAV